MCFVHGRGVRLTRRALPGSALSLVYNYHAALRSAILAETGLLGITEPLIEAGAHMAAGEGGVQRERLLARRGMSKTVGESPEKLGTSGLRCDAAPSSDACARADGFYNPAGLPKFYEAFTGVSAREICR